MPACIRQVQTLAIASNHVDPAPFSRGVRRIRENDGTMIKRVAVYFAVFISLAGASLAQNSASAPAYNFEARVFAEDFRLGRISPTLDMPGVGARFSLFPQSWFQLEIEGSYDFSQTFTSTWTNGFVSDNLT